MAFSLWPGGGLKAQLKHAEPLKRAVPATVTVAGASIPLWTYQQLTNVSKLALSTRAQDLQKQLGATSLPPLPTSRGAAVVGWMIRAEVAAAALAGLTISEADLGLTPDLQAERAHQLRPGEKARLQAAGFDMGSIPAANLGGEVGAPTADVAHEGSKPSYDWAEMRSTASAYDTVHWDLRAQATCDSAAGAEASRTRNSGSQVREAMKRSDPEGESTRRSITKSDFPDHAITAAEITRAIRPSDRGHVVLQ